MTVKELQNHLDKLYPLPYETRFVISDYNLYVKHPTIETEPHTFCTNIRVHLRSYLVNELVYYYIVRFVGKIYNELIDIIKFHGDKDEFVRGLPKAYHRFNEICDGWVDKDDFIQVVKLMYKFTKYPLEYWKEVDRRVKEERNIRFPIIYPKYDITGCLLYHHGMVSWSNDGVNWYDGKPVGLWDGKLSVDVGNKQIKVDFWEVI